MQINTLSSSETLSSNPDMTQSKLKLLLISFTNKPYHYAAGMVILVFLIFFVWGSAHLYTISHEINSSKQQSASIYAFNDKLLDMDAKLALIENQLNNAPNQKNEAQMQAQLTALKQQLDILSSETQAAIASGVDKTNQQFQIELKEVNENVAALTHSIEPTTYLPASHLPFTVTAIDMVAVTPVVTVNYGYHTLPLEAQDSLAGWTLQQADFLAQTAVFINEEHQAVKVVLTPIITEAR